MRFRISSPLQHGQVLHVVFDNWGLNRTSVLNGSAFNHSHSFSPSSQVSSGNHSGGANLTTNLTAAGNLTGNLTAPANLSAPGAHAHMLKVRTAANKHGTGSLEVVVLSEDAVGASEFVLWLANVQARQWAGPSSVLLRRRCVLLVHLARAGARVLRLRKVLRLHHTLPCHAPMCWVYGGGARE